jgi:hypothetical protein
LPLLGCVCVGVPLLQLGPARASEKVRG